MTKFPKGSEWRKWDYHVHTPASWHYGDRGADAYERLIKTINASDVAVFGINDYLTIDGYLQLKGKVNKAIFPVVEFRMDNILAEKDKKGGSGPNFNFHLFFSNEEACLPKIKAFLGSLQFKDYQRNTKNFTPDEILEFGKQVLSKETDQAKLLAAALEKIKFDFFEVLKLLKDKGLRNECVVILPYDEYGGIDGVNPLADGLHKSGLIKETDVLGSSSEVEREYFLGEANSKYTAEQFSMWFGRPKPIIKGSDAHKPEDAGKLPARKDGTEIHCWIKADPTFNGFKQILYEPKERIFIGSTFPDNKDKSKVISSIAIRTSGAWFDDQKIPINRDLVTVIGGKGSGKTALVDLLGLVGGDFDSKNSASFLNKANKELIGTKVLLQWEDGATESELEIRKPLIGPETPKVRYLSQSFVESLCSFDRHEELEREIENILFQYVPGPRRLGTASFHALKEKQTEGVKLEIDRISTDLAELNGQVHDLKLLIASRDKLAQEKDRLDKDITELHKQKPQPSTDAEKKAADELKQLNEQRAKIATEIEKLRIKWTKLDFVSKILGLIVDSVERYNREIETALSEIGEDELQPQLKISLPSQAGQTIATKISEISHTISTLEGGHEGVIPAAVTLNSLDDKIATIKKKSSIEVQKRDKLQEFDKRIIELTQRRTALTQKIGEIDTIKRKELDLKIEQRSKLFLSFFMKLEDKRKVLESLYEPLNTRKDVTAEGAKVQFYARFNFDAEKFSVNAEGLFDNRKSVIRGEKGFVEVGSRFWDEISQTLPNATPKPMEGLMATLQARSDEGAQPVAEQLRPSKTEKDFDDWLFSLEYYDVEYGIKYEGIDLDSLSPGKKGVVLLLIYLTIDKDYRPLIIDQPEENLDNRSVYTTLVDYFRKAKRNRQVIIVTHNPNLVVNGDAEQVIVANFEKDCLTQKTKIKYISGSLEYSEVLDLGKKNVLEQQGVREHVCELLEGGAIAFSKREEKYELQKVG